MKHRWILAASLAVVFVLQAAWGEAFPTGTFQATIRSHKWEIVFKNGSYVVSRDGQVGVEGVYKVKGHEITLTDTKGDNREEGDKSTGVYKWEFNDEENELTLTEVKDPATGRKNVLTAGPWSRAEE